MSGATAVFFDAAGTLFDSREPVGRVYARIAREFGLGATDEQVTAGFRRAFANAGGLAFGPGHTAAELRRLEREWWHRLVRRSFDGLGAFTDFDSFFDRLFAHFANPANWRADPEAVSTLMRLKSEGAIVGVISNFDYRLYRILDGLGVAKHLDSVTISSEAGYAKPDPAVFGVALAKHGLSPSAALHVGDVEQLDVIGARAAGLMAVLFDPQQSHEVRSDVETIDSLATVPILWRSIQFA